MERKSREKGNERDKEDTETSHLETKTSKEERENTSGEKENPFFSAMSMAHDSRVLHDWLQLRPGV